MRLVYIEQHLLGSGVSSSRHISVFSVIDAQMLEIEFRAVAIGTL